MVKAYKEDRQATSRERQAASEKLKVQEEFRQQLLDQAATVRSVEAANSLQHVWLTSRIELLSDILETPEQISLALADQSQQTVSHNGGTRSAS